MIERDIFESYMQPGLLDFKQHLRITNNDQDALLMQCLKAAAVSAEHHIGRCLLRSKFRYTCRFASSISLEKVNDNYYPLQRVLSCKVDGVYIPLDSMHVSGHVITFDESVVGDMAEVVYEAGGRCVEPDIQAAILLTAAKLYNNPVDSVETLPSVATNLLGQYRRWGDGE